MSKGSLAGLRIDSPLLPPKKTSPFGSLKIAPIVLLLSPSANTSPGGIIEKNVRLDNTVTNPIDLNLESPPIDTTK